MQGVRLLLCATLYSMGLVSSAGAQTVRIDFERFPGVDGRLGTADDVPTEVGGAVADQYICQGARFSLSDGTHPLLTSTGTRYLPLSPMVLFPAAVYSNDESHIRDIVIQFTTPASRVRIYSQDTDERVTLRAFNAAGEEIANDYQPPVGNTLEQMEVRVDGSRGYIVQVLIDLSQSSNNCCAAGPEFYDLLEFDPVDRVDACEDADSDGVIGFLDQCPGTSPGTPVDERGCPLPVTTGWTLTGSMVTGRLLHTATLLNSGQVLVAGGYNQISELYDPNTGEWIRTGSTLASRRYHTMTLLPDGRVLMAGGGQCPRTGASAEVYNPSSGRWLPTGNLITYRSSHAAALLPNGRVLVMGGTDRANNVLSSAELYDPATGTWAPTGQMGTARRSHTATLLPDGQVLVTGGSNSSSSHLRSAELYNPATGTWTPAGTMIAARQSHTAMLLNSGKMLVAGGGSNIADSISAELFDPVTRTWSTTGSLTVPRRNHTATLLRSGKVLLSGGYHQSTGILASSELYDPATGTWSATSSMNVDRYFHTATLLPDGRVLAVGGASNTDQASAELYGQSRLARTQGR